MRWLTLVTFLPLAGALALALWPRITDRDARRLALGVSSLTFIAALGLLGRFDPADAGFQLVEQARWLRSPAVQYLVGVDGISLFLVVLTALLTPIVILASWRVDRRPRMFLGALLVLETACIGSFIALDLLLFFVFFEAMLFPMYLLIGIWGSDRRMQASIKFFLYTMLGSAFLFVAILVLYRESAALATGPTLDVRALADLALPVGLGRWLFAAFFVAFAVKVPIFPLHTWLPDAHTEAPTAGSVILAAVMLKIGGYGLVRFNLGLFPEAAHAFGTAITVLAVVGIIYGAVVAIVQTDVKRLIAYSSVSHLGFVVLGIFAFDQQGMTGAVAQMINHGLSTGALFLLIGMLYERTHTRDLAELGGAASVMPLFAGCLLFATVSSLGLPGLNNFVGEFLVVTGAFATSGWLGAGAVAGVVLAAVYLLWAYQRVAQGEAPIAHAAHPDLSVREGAVLLPVLVLILALGVFPRPMLERIEPSAARVLDAVTEVAP